MIQTNSGLTGLEKASVLLLSLGTEASEEVLKRLSPKERDMLGAQIVRMRSVKSITRQQVLDEVSQAVRSGKKIDFDAGPLKWLEGFEPERVAQMLTGERPQTIALIVSHLSPNMAADVLKNMGERIRNMVVQRLATMGPASEHGVKAVDEMMRKRATAPASPQRDAESLLKVLSSATTRARESILATISRAHSSQGMPSMPTIPELSSLDDLMGLPDELVKEVLRELDLDDLCLALRVAGEDLVELITRNVPGATAMLLHERMNAPGHVRVREIEIAQQRIAGSLRRISQGNASVHTQEAFIE